MKQQQQQIFAQKHSASTGNKENPLYMIYRCTTQVFAEKAVDHEVGLQRFNIVTNVIMDSCPFISKAITLASGA